VQTAADANHARWLLVGGFARGNLVEGASEIWDTQDHTSSHTDCKVRRTPFRLPAQRATRRLVLRGTSANPGIPTRSLSKRSRNAPDSGGCKWGTHKDPRGAAGPGRASWVVRDRPHIGTDACSIPGRCGGPALHFDTKRRGARPSGRAPRVVVGGFAPGHSGPGARLVRPSARRRARRSTRRDRRSRPADPS
jgi:hypothetical protein